MGAVFPCNLGLSSFTPNSNKPDIIIIIMYFCNKLQNIFFVYEDTS